MKLHINHDPVRVLTFEAAAIDLFRHIQAAGYIDNAVTVLQELSEEIDRAKLLELAKNTELSYFQRFGFLLDFVGWSNIADPLADLVAVWRPCTALMRPEQPINAAKNDDCWRLLINENVDSDT